MRHFKPGWFGFIQICRDPWCSDVIPTEQVWWDKSLACSPLSKCLGSSPDLAPYFCEMLFAPLAPLFGFTHVKMLLAPLDW